MCKEGSMRRWEMICIKKSSPNSFMEHRERIKSENQFDFKQLLVAMYLLIEL